MRSWSQKAISATRKESLPPEPPENDAALRHLQQVHRPALIKFLARQTGGDVHRAEDIAQETMLRAWRNPASRGADGRWSRAWIYTVAKHILIDQARAAEVRPAELRDPRLELHAGSADPMDGVTDALSDVTEVRAALSSLPEHLRVAIVAVYYLGLSSTQAARVLGIPAGTVKSRCFYAVKALREALMPCDVPYGPSPPAGR